MKTSYPGIYAASVIGITANVLSVRIPQVFADATVPVTDFAGSLPTGPSTGWVMFESGDAAYPVWIGVQAPVTAPAPPPTPGPTGSSYVHTQATPAATWVINHNLGFFPAITVEDSAGNEVEGAITYNSANQVTITFSAAFSGRALLS